MISVVIPVMNEEDNIGPLIAHTCESLGSLEFEIIFVDDGSTDKTVEKIKSVADPRVQVVVLNRNYGQTTAMAAGIEAARGAFIATMDGDMQNDPADIPMMLDILENQSWDVVAGKRAKRKDGWFWRKLPSLIANWLIRHSTGVYLNDYGCTLKIFRADVAKNLGLYGELHRFIPVLATLYGARITEVDVRHHPRQHGTSKYGIRRTLGVLSDLIFILFLERYLQKPMHFFGTLGLLLFFSGSCVNLYLLVVKIMGQNIGQRPLLLLGVMITIAGLQLITTGFLAELVMRNYFEKGRTPKYVIKEHAGKKMPPDV